MSVVTDMFYKKGAFFLEKSEYKAGNNLAIKSYSDSGEFYGLITVNLPNEELGKDEAFLDTNNLPDIDKVIIESGVGVPTGDYGYSGFCEYPKFKFDLEKIDTLHKKATY